MRIFRRALLVSLCGNTPVALLILLLHRLRFPLWDAAGIIGVTAFAGAMAAMRGVWRVEPSEQQRHVTKFALLLPVIILSVHATAWTVVHYQDSRFFLPNTVEHGVAIFSAVASLLGWFMFAHRTDRKRKNA